jgi:hypothetical protein
MIFYNPGKELSTLLEIQKSSLEKAQMTLFHYPTYSGLILECYFREKMKERKLFTDIGGYWDRKGLNKIEYKGLSIEDM